MFFPLGPFQLIRPIGRGGMGVVWLGRHTEQDVPVAVKVLKPRPGRSAEVHRKAFLQEVRAVSALDHPGVVWIFDSGTLPEETAQGGGEELAAGSPYLVMEYASRGTLRQLKTPPTWPELKAILLALLDALAHAHARGVLHRDLKPDNVLIAGTKDLRPGFKITDFGIAHLLDEGPREDHPVGTPQYMAPEQIRSEAGSFGPHTDLYALGSMMWRVVTGRLPHHGLKGPSLMYAQLTRDPPPLEPLVEVPDGFEDFLRTLLRKEPHERFQRAADAALALARLPDPMAEPVRRLVLEEDDLGLENTSTLRILIGNAAEGDTTVDPTLRPPFPSTWRMPPTAPTRPLRLMGAGMGLFGIRPVPFVGRDDERDVLWQTLAQVHETQQPRVVVVSGASGVGKSRLVHWVADRAHEVGGAHVLRATFSSSGGGGQGQIGLAVVRLLRSLPLSQADVVARFGPIVAGRDLPAEGILDGLEAMLDPDDEPMGDRQRDMLVRQILEVLAADRPILAVLDDVHWGPDGVRLAQQLLEVGADGHLPPIAVVLTVLESAQDRDVDRMLSALIGRPGTVELPLSVLGMVQREELAQELLGLERGLAAAVAERTGGNPLFAVQLVEHWVDRGLLVAGPTGFVLRDPDQVFPADLREVWDGRVRQLVQGLEAPALSMLERSAVLGRDVDVLEWQAACDDPDGRHAATGRLYFNPRHARLRQQLMDRLLASGLWQETEEGFVCVHAQLRDTVRDRSMLAGRYRDHALACASTLDPEGKLGNVARIGTHLFDAGQFDDAIPSLFAGARWARRGGGPHEALELLSVAEGALEEAGRPADHRRWAELEVLRACNHRDLGRLDEAGRCARRGAKLADAGGWPELGAEAYAVLAGLASTLGLQDKARERWRHVVTLLGGDGDAFARVRGWQQLWRIARRTGDVEQAEICGEQVRQVLLTTRDRRARARGDAAVAETLVASERFQQAHRHATRSLSDCRAAGDLSGQARALHLIATSAQAQGRWSEAVEAMAQCVGCLADLGRPHVLLWRCRLALLQAQARDYEATERTIFHAGEPHGGAERAAAHICLALVAAGRGDAAMLDAHLGICEGLYPGLSSPDEDFSHAARLVGELAIAAGDRARGRRALILARDLHAAGGNDAEVRDLDRHIVTL